jgi:hypothetical protein
MGNDDLVLQIGADFEAAFARLSALPAPADHAWRQSPGALTWFADDVLASTRFGASIFLSRMPFDPHDPNQLHVEVRLFWNSTAGEAQRAHAHRAILWIEQGRRFAGQNRSLLGRPSFFFDACTIDDLCDAIERPIRAILPFDVPAVAA